MSVQYSGGQVFAIGTLSCLIVAAAVGVGFYSVGVADTRKEAIAAGVAEYRLKSPGGTETEFVWKKP